MGKINYQAHENFIAYEEEMVSDPAYSGMPDLRYEDGSIQWETPSNRKSGVFRDSHDKRLQWWKNKAESIGISTTENEWISKTAKAIHPTKRRPCKFCGKYMDIRYCYLSENLIKRIKKLPYVTDELDITYTTYIFDFISQFIDLYGEKAFKDLPDLLKCKQIPELPKIENTIDAWISWIETNYIVLEPSMLGPGAMSNAPDRLDGFHSFNRCCRSMADKGRSRSNLASYATDRRAIEHWVGGNWAVANKLMGLINSEPELKQHTCLNVGDGGKHPLPCSADHIGPLSLGFAHRPAFQLLCKPCNSAKNNRMYYSDVLNLREAEANGDTVTTWYSYDIWHMLNPRVADKEGALKLSRVLRDNRFNAMYLLASLLEDKQYIFLYSLLNLQYADYNYKITGWQIKNHIVIAEYTQSPSTLIYVEEQKARRVRVAFESLKEYAVKDKRNGLEVPLKSNQVLYQQCLLELGKLDGNHVELNRKLMQELERPQILEENIRTLISEIPDLSDDVQIYKAFQCIRAIMKNIANYLSEMWDHPRYERDLNEYEQYLGDFEQQP